MRTAFRLLLPLTVAAALMAAGGALQQSAASVGDPTTVGPAHYVVRADPRLCPSPLCGGYWLSLANHARTRCHDGLLRPRCYVASILDTNRQPLKASIVDGTLARGTIDASSFGGFGELGVLVAGEVFPPAGRAEPSGRFFRLVDTRIRCIRAPCFSIRASQLNRSSQSTLSDVDVGTPQLTPHELSRVETALGRKNGVLAQGRVVASEEGGRLFRATRFFLRSES